MIPVKVWRGNESLSTPTGTVTPYPPGTSLICRWSGFDSGSSNSQGDRASVPISNMSCLSHCRVRWSPFVGETLQIYAIFLKERYVFRKNRFN